MPMCEVSEQIFFGINLGKSSRTGFDIKSPFIISTPHSLQCYTALVKILYFLSRTSNLLKVKGIFQGVEQPNRDTQPQDLQLSETCSLQGRKNLLRDLKPF